LSAANEGGSTAAERSASYPCDGCVPGADLEVFRAIDIAAPPPVVFRWLCRFDLLMMRKQFLTLKRLAEETAMAARRS
jgi:hypothetical protein